MAKRKRDWTWRRLAETAAERRPARRIEYKGDPALRGVRQHIPHSTTPALDRFFAMTQRVRINGDYCIVWRGGDTFRVDDDTVTTPARFYWEAMKGEKLGASDVLRRGCKTPRCVKHKKR